MLFKYQGFDSNGKKLKSKIEALNLNEAKSKLKAKNILYTSLEEEDFNFSKISFKRKRTLSLSSLSYLSRDLSIYLNSGISLISAINLLKQRYKDDKVLNSFFESISTYLDEGKNFYVALDSQTVVNLPEFYKQSIKISENGGLLESVLLELSTFLKEQDRIKKQVTSALAYPLFILFISFFMVGFMLSFIVPKITDIFTQIDQELPDSTKIVIALGDFFSNNYMYIIAVVFTLILTFLFLMKRSKTFKYAFDKFVLKLPFFSTMIEQGELARFSYMNSILIKSGVPIVQGINLSANILKNSVIKRVFVEASKSVVEGKKLSVLLSTNKIYKIDEAFIHSIAIGEDTSKLSEILSNLATLYNEANKDKTDIFLALLEPIFMLFVGVTIGFIVISMLLPIFSMNLS
ncbi:type II secretion system F family protein [Poseidonibacter lekithochrous]|uniref:type II secretion system F family protein n=1 Tax=Poseidonibacter TaxID=2321187 RepID=UPI001C09A01F|nr:MULTISPECIES: type II secretion system F family protein [Poseidonibacter]MBU3015860.1 type II secretion system F family protein [Poseidonibacter lekithochrous]MDO6829159.1 type II secretion system F family protein [Poseidonibacter sp. 1_MG-2023]